MVNLYFVSFLCLLVRSSYSTDGQWDGRTSGRARPVLRPIRTASELLSLVDFLGEIALAQATSSVVTHFSVAWSVVCHLLALCLNRSTDLHAIWQVHFGGPMTLFVRWRFLTPSGRVDLGVEPPLSKLVIAYL